MLTVSTSVPVAEKSNAKRTFAVMPKRNVLTNAFHVNQNSTIVSKTSTCAVRLVARVSVVF